MNKSKTALKIQPSPDYQAKLATPFAVLGLRIEEDWLTDIEYLPLDTPTLAPQTPLAREICDQLQAYLADPCFTFDLSMHIGGTVHQRRVWHMILDIPSGTTRSYAEIAAQLHSAPRAVGQACGANRLPIIIPCHRVIAKSGGLGGFMNASDGSPSISSAGYCATNVAELDIALLDEFLDALWLEDGLSRNTLESYRGDLRQFGEWLGKQKQNDSFRQDSSAFIDATHSDLLRFLAQKAAVKAKASTASRQLSSLKRLYRFLLRQGKIQADPTLNIDSPKLPRNLPVSLTEAEVEALLLAPDIAQPLGLRDRTMLEVLYASGLRVSELVSLEAGQISLSMGVVRVLGKGGKERLTPLGEEALGWVVRYTREVRPGLLRWKVEQCDVHYLPGFRHDTTGVLVSDQALCPTGGYNQAAFTPYLASCFCHTYAQSRSRFACRSTAIRPRRYFHHPNLYSCGARAAEAAPCHASPAWVMG